MDRVGEASPERPGPSHEKLRAHFRFIRKADEHIRGNETLAAIPIMWLAGPTQVQGSKPAAPACITGQHPETGCGQFTKQNEQKTAVTGTKIYPNKNSGLIFM